MRNSLSHVIISGMVAVVLQDINIPAFWYENPTTSADEQYHAKT